MMDTAIKRLAIETPKGHRGLRLSRLATIVHLPSPVSRRLSSEPLRVVSAYGNIPLYEKMCEKFANFS